MRLLARLLAVSLAVTACESRPPEPPARQPTPAAPAPAPAPAPAVAPAPTPDELPQIAGVHYLEFTTAGADADAALPMIIAIHGLGDSPEGFRDLLDGFDRPARVILPRALDAHEPGWSWFPLRARDKDIEALAAGIRHAADTLAPAIEQLAATRPTVGKPIVTGFSQGGMLSFTLAVHHGQLLGAALPVGGWLPEPLWPRPDADASTAPPIIAFHGDADVAVRYEPTVQVIEQLKQAGYRVELHTYPGIGHMIPPDMRADLFAALRAQLPE